MRGRERMIRGSIDLPLRVGNSAAIGNCEEVAALDEAGKLAAKLKGKCA